MMCPNVGYGGDFGTGVPNGCSTVDGINTVDGSSWLTDLSYHGDFLCMALMCLGIVPVCISCWVKPMC